MKEHTRTRGIVVLNTKMTRLQIPQNIVYKKFYAQKFDIHKIAAVNLSKMFLKNIKKTSKPNNRDLNRV